MNIIEMGPGWQGYPEHDHTADGQEEVYILLAGSAELRAGDQVFALDTGTVARVGPSVTRKLVPGPDGATVLALGSTPGTGYVRPDWG